MTVKCITLIDNVRLSLSLIYPSCDQQLLFSSSINDNNDNFNNDNKFTAADTYQHQ